MRYLFVGIAICICCTSFIRHSIENKEHTSPAIDGILFSNEADDLRFCYRIPAIATCKDGSLIAFCDERIGSFADVATTSIIKIVCRRSYDQGKSWTPKQYVVGEGLDTPGQAFSDPAVVVDQTSGNIVVFCVYGRSIHESSYAQPQRILRMESCDNGKTWNAPADITHQFYISESFDAIFMTSGRVLQLHDGRIAAAMFVKCKYEEQFVIRNYVFISSDLGSTWKLLGDVAVENGDEAKLEELPDGRIMISSRKFTGSGRYYNYFTFSDQTYTTGQWGKQIDCDNPNVNRCNAEIRLITSVANDDALDLMLFSAPDDPETRRKLTLFRASHTDTADQPTPFMQWEPIKIICEGPSKYSTMTVLPDRSIVLFYEAGDPYNKLGKGAQCQMIVERIAFDELVN